MVSVFNETMNKESVMASPKDEILNGVIVNIEKGELGEFVPEQYHGSFDNLDQPTLKIHYEVKFNDKVLVGSDRLPYYDEPMSNSKLGKFLEKYNELKTGQTIKVIYDGNGFNKIKID